MKRITNPFFNFLLISLICVFASSAVFADDDDDDDDDDDEYTFTPADVNQLARDEVSIRLEPLGFGLMGDSIDPYTGTLMFNQTDVSLPGNSDLEVAVRRIASTAQMTNMQEMFFGDWILDVPNISSLHGSFTLREPVRGDTVTFDDWSGARCRSGRTSGGRLTMDIRSRANNRRGFTSRTDVEIPYGAWGMAII